MLALFKRAEPRQPHLVVDSNGKYYGIYPTLSSARSVVDEIMASKDPPPSIFIYKADLIDQADRDTPIELTDYKSSV